jgi:hypothetical protein
MWRTFRGAAAVDVTMDARCRVRHRASLLTGSRARRPSGYSTDTFSLWVPAVWPDESATIASKVT